MLKNKTIVLLIFLLAHCGNVFGMESKLDSFNMKRESIFFDRNKEGLWTTEQDLNSNKILYKVTEPEHQREEWYAVTPYIAEFYSTISNAGFFYVASKFMKDKPLSSTALLLAGGASAVSHAIPRHWLNLVDRVGAVAAPLAVAYDCRLYDYATLLATISNPRVLCATLATGAILFVDHALANSKWHAMQIRRKKYQTKTHVSWHLIAAYLAFAILSYATR